MVRPRVGGDPDPQQRCVAAAVCSADAVGQDAAVSGWYRRAGRTGISGTPHIGDR
jgi:hypothetical protein